MSFILCLWFAVQVFMGVFRALVSTLSASDLRGLNDERLKEGKVSNEHFS